MKNPAIFLCFILFSYMVWGQPSQEEVTRIRSQMAKIRQTTNWDDPAAAKKANEEIQKLARQLTGNPNQSFQYPQQQSAQPKKQESVGFVVKVASTKEGVLAIADRFYKRSYNALDAVSKVKFDQDYETAKKDNFSLAAVRKLTSAGGALITFGKDHFLACVYLTSAVKAAPEDTLCINNFGGYLRIIDSVAVSVPVLEYANKLYPGSPVIQTQLGNSYFELNDQKNAETWYKAAIKCNPDFGQAHSALTTLYIKQGKLKEAILELFAGVKGMGASYNQATNNFAQIQQQYGGSSRSDDFSSKKEFWNETKNQMNPSNDPSSPPFQFDRLKMPAFPDCPRVEDWMEGGGYMKAVQAYSAFHNQMLAFVTTFQQVHKQYPSLSPNAMLRDYPNERFALDCITEMFFKYSKEEARTYYKSIDEIMHRVADAKELYLKNFEEYSKTYGDCIKGCSDEYCVKECHRVYCSQECPNANKYNNLLKQAYNDYRVAFSGMVSKQIKLLDDLYGFSGPWLAKMYSPYWSKIYAYEIQRVALSIIGQAYGAYPQGFQLPAHNDCGTDCSLFAVPYPKNAEQVDTKDPKGNECDSGSKTAIPLIICEVSLDCESVELECSAIASAAVKRNFVKKTTTLFVGAGLEANLGLVKAGGKFGGTLTIGDDNSVDVGLKGTLSSTVTVPTGQSYKGAEKEFNLSVMGGLNVETTKVAGPPGLPDGILE